MNQRILPQIITSAKIRQSISWKETLLILSALVIGLGHRSWSSFLVIVLGHRFVRETQNKASLDSTPHGF